MSAEPAMPDGGFPKDRSALAGLGEAMLDLLAGDSTDGEWGACLQAPYERAASAGDTPLSIALLKAGARGNHLHPAVRGGHDHLVTELLRLGASPVSKDEHGDAPLHIAASLARVSIVKTLLKIEGVDEFEVDAKGRTPAHLACWNGHVPTVEALVDATKGNWRSGARHRLGKTNVGFTPFDLAVRADHVGVNEMLCTRWPNERASSLTDGAILHQAAEQDNAPMIDFLVGEAGTDVDCGGDGGLTPLHRAAMHGASQAMAALVRHGADASALDEGGLRPLHHAATAGDVAAIDVLCIAGVDTNLRVKQNFCYPPEFDTWSALDFAAIEGNVDAFKALVRHGADWKALSGDGLTVLNTAAASNKPELIDVLIELGAPVDGPAGVDATPLYTATGAYSSDAVRALVRHGASVQKKPNSELDSPLYNALMWGHQGGDVVSILVDNGADPNEIGDGTSGLLTMFEFNGTEDVLEALLRGGAKVTEPTYDGEYFVHQAVNLFDGAKAIELLAEAGADVNAASPGGLTPLQMACSKGDGPAIAALVKHGAAIDVVDDDGNSPLHLAAVEEGSRDSIWRLREKVTGGVDALLKADADETATNNNGHTPEDRVRLELAGDDHRESIKPVLKLLERAPNERAWRRRSFWVLGRTFPERVRIELKACHPKVLRVDRGNAAGSEDGEECDGSTKGEGTGDISAVSARVLGLHEEGIFRTVIGFL